MNAGDPKPTDRLERALQASLRPVDPGADFTAAVQARLVRGALRPLVHSAPMPANRPQWLHATSLALAASVVVALASLTISVRKLRIMASRAVDSQHTLVCVPVTMTFSMPSARNSGSIFDEP